MPVLRNSARSTAGALMDSNRFLAMSSDISPDCADGEAVVSKSLLDQCSAVLSQRCIGCNPEGDMSIE